MADDTQQKSPKKTTRAKASSLREGFSRDDIKRTVTPWYEDLMTALRFLTRIPIPEDAHPQGKGLLRAARAFPLTGLVVGGAGAASMFFALQVNIPAEAACALALVLMVLITGGLHEDGLADSSDALFATTDHEERLEILKDSRSGVFAMLAVFFVILTKWSVLVALAEEAPFYAALALMTASILSRVAFLIPICFLEPMREDGLGAALKSLSPPSMIVPLAAGGIPAFFLLGGNIPTLVMSFAAAALMAFFVSFLARRQLGGYNGDIAGATQQLSEAAVLVAISMTFFA